MKSSLLFFVFCLGSTFAATPANPQTLITFDDLPLQTYGEAIPNGYAGLQWDFFGVLEPQAAPYDPVGYLNGMVSPRHVAFNAYANSDGTTTGGFHSLGFVFDLDSAYLTASFNDGMQVTVRASSGGVLKYTSTYSLNTMEATLVNFNWLGIDAVGFTSSGGKPHGNPLGGGSSTVIDNLVITVPEPATAGLFLFGACCTGYWFAKRSLKGRQAP